MYGLILLIYTMIECNWIAHKLKHDNTFMKAMKCFKKACLFFFNVKRLDFVKLIYHFLKTVSIQNTLYKFKISCLDLFDKDLNYGNLVTKVCRNVISLECFDQS